MTIGIIISNDNTRQASEEILTISRKSFYTFAQEIDGVWIALLSHQSATDEPMWAQNEILEKKEDEGECR